MVLLGEAEDEAGAGGEGDRNGFFAAEVFVGPEVADMGGGDETEVVELDLAALGFVFAVEEADDPIAVRELADPDLAVVVGGIGGEGPPARSGS